MKRQPTWPTGRGTAVGLNVSRRTRAVDPVGADHEIVVVVRSVAELDGDDAVALSEAFDGEPHADRHVTGRLEQQLVQVGSVQREAWPDGRPKLGDVDLGEQPAAVVVEALPRDLDGSGGDLRLESEGAQGASGVAGQIDAGTGRPPHGFALDHLGRDTDAREHARQRQAGDPATDDQHAPCAHHFTARRVRSGRAAPVRRSGTRTLGAFRWQSIIFRSF